MQLQDRAVTPELEGLRGGAFAPEGSGTASKGAGSASEGARLAPLKGAGKGAKKEPPLQKSQKVSKRSIRP